MRRLATIVGLLLFLSPPVWAAEWKIFKAEGRDYVSLDNIAAFYNFPGSIPLASQIDPVSFNTPLSRRLAIKSEAAEVEVTTNSREILINGVKHWLGFPVLIKDDKLLVSRLDLAKTIEPALRPQFVKDIEPVRTVVLDPGHGGHDKGATCAYGMEKDFALDVGMRAKKLLEEQGLKVVMTRDSDEFIPLEARPRIANRLDDVIFVSIHFNSSLSNRTASGFEVFSLTPRGAPSTDNDKLTRRDLRDEPGNRVDVPSAVLANAIFHAMIGEVPQVDRGLKRARFAVLRLAKVPAVLVECGFVSNPDEARLIASAAWRANVAKAIVEGIIGFKRLAKTGIAPNLVADYRRDKPNGAGIREEPAVLTNTEPTGPDREN